MFSEFFDDLDYGGATISDPIADWLSKPTFSVDPIAYWTGMKSEGHPLAQMALDFLSVPGKFINFKFPCFNTDHL